MRWHDLLFLHWPVPAAALRPLVPPALEIDECRGSAWLGIVPFVMRGVRLRLVPPIPSTGAFPELNVRTYVRHGATRGVWFFSLDAASRLAVEGARRLYRLPYRHAAMRCRREGDEVAYASRRLETRFGAAELAARYRPAGPVFRHAAGSLEHFLTHRLCLYTADRRNAIYRSDIEHAPWPLAPADVALSVNRMTEPLGIALPDTPPLAWYAARLDVRAGRLRRV